MTTLTQAIETTNNNNPDRHFTKSTGSTLTFRGHNGGNTGGDYTSSSSCISTNKENETMSPKEAAIFSMMEETSSGQNQQQQHHHHHHSTSTSSCCSETSEENLSTDQNVTPEYNIISNSNLLLSKKMIDSLNDSKCNIEKSNGKSKFLIYLIIGIFVVLISYLLVMSYDSMIHHVVNLSIPPSTASTLAKSVNTNLLNRAESITDASNITAKKEKKKIKILSELYKPEHYGIAKYIKPLEPKTRIIGRREMIHFPQLGVINLLAKVDSGAKTSCLDVANIRHNKSANTISFDVVLDRHNRSIVQTILDFPFSNTTKTVMSSNGHISTRYVLKTIVSIGPEFQDQIAEFTLVERHKLACPVLIGRNIIRMGGFLVDCNKKFITGKKQKTVVQEPIHIPDLVDYPIPPPPNRKRSKKKKKTENQ